MKIGWESELTIGFTWTFKADRSMSFTDLTFIIIPNGIFSLKT